MRNFMPVPNWIVLYECNRCWGYLPEQSFIEKDNYEYHRPLAYEEAVELKRVMAWRWVLSD